MHDVTFYAFLPLLKNKVGHIHSYNLAVAQAVKCNGWNYKALIAKSCEIDDLPYDHEQLFLSSNWEKNRALFHKIIKPLFSIGKLYRFLRGLETQNSILFMESFFPGHFFAFFLALLFVGKKFTFALLHRYSPKDPKYTVVYHIYACLQWLVKNKIRLVLLTDTDSLAREQQACFKRKVHLLPIPLHMTPYPKYEGKKLICWWPGGSVRTDKGLETICKLSSMLRYSNEMQLVMAENAKPHLSCLHDALHFLPKNLSEEDYEKWMHKAHLILLPYLPGLYRERSSGIFVEAICAGAIPVTSDDTWMASELKRFDLQELLMNWQSPTLVQDLIALSLNKDMQTKLAKMRTHYLLTHSIKNFGAVLRSSLKESQEEPRRYLVRHPGIPIILKIIDSGLSLLKITRNDNLAPPKRILLCNGAHLGDLINATAVIPILRASFPDAKIGFVVGSWSRQVIEGHPDITWIHEFDHWKINRVGNPISRYFKTGWRTLREIKKIRYDVCIDLYAFFGNMIPLIFMAGIPSRIGFTSGGFSPLLTHPVKWQYDGMAIVDSYLGLVNRLPIQKEHISLLGPQLPPSKEKRIRNENYVIIHPGAGAHYKEWPLENWQELVKNLSHIGIAVVATGYGESEKATANILVEEEQNYCGKLNWQEFVTLVAHAKCVIGVDSVVGHLAAALKVPSFTILPGIHPEKEWLPYGLLSQAIGYEVPCSPCRLRRGCSTMACVRKTSPQLIFEKIKACCK